ncbi:MAG: YitT family protein [Acholeplasmataceae bacterium]|nr:YitT family protein [Acholeplasmataceae bacterium]MDD4194502.1 YitT family protein [Acholeplasmataceae bacterium]
MNKAKWREVIEITAGVILMSVGFYFFLLPFNLIIGGVMGVSVILQDVIPISTFMYIANTVLLIIGLIFLGKVFFIKTIYATLLSPTIIFILERLVSQDFFVKHLTESPLMISALFGGIFLGVGIGIVFRSNATTGGIDIIQNILNKYLHIPFSTAIYLTDGVIILYAILINFQLGLYALGSMILTALIVDKLSIEGKSGYTVFIITNYAELMQEKIFLELERGVTLVDAMGGFSKEKKTMIVCTVDRNQLYLFKRIIKQVDPKAFTFVTRTKEALGEGFSREVASWEVKS